jgi:hypothetical protein
MAAWLDTFTGEWAMATEADVGEIGVIHNASLKFLSFESRLPNLWLYGRQPQYG